MSHCQEMADDAYVAYQERLGLREWKVERAAITTVPSKAERQAFVDRGFHAEI